MNKIAEACKILSNTKRLLILQYVEQCRSFEEIRSKFNANNNTVTFHLKKLCDGDMVVKKDSKYCINHYGKMALDFWRKFEKLCKNH